VPSARALLARASAELAQAGVATPQVDAELLLAHVTGRPRLTLGLVGEVPPEQEHAFAALIERRVAREPLQHLIGVAPFRHLMLMVGPGVFVPRPETELLVDAVLAHLRGSIRAGRGPEVGAPAETWTGGSPAGSTPAGSPAAGSPPPPGSPPAGSSPARAPAGPVLVDLCTGSAAIALSLASEMPGARVHAVELSEDALAWARRNVAEHSGAVRAAGSELLLVPADATDVAEPGAALAELAGTVDVVVTNPPYVPDAAVPREPEVRDHDPHLALFGGPDGLDVIRPLARQAALLLRPGGLLLVEHADAQGEGAGPLGVPGLLRSLPDPQWSADRTQPTPTQAAPSSIQAAPSSTQAAPSHTRVAASPPPAWQAVTDHPDLAGRPRFTSAIRSGQDRIR
jgi:release factor glutamine methyltransferase